jgi:hypothetical protein
MTSTPAGSLGRSHAGYSGARLASSAAEAFLGPVRRNGRLTVRLRTRADRIVTEHGRAVGIELDGADDPGDAQRASFAPGALITPQLLSCRGSDPQMSFGVWHSSYLRSAGRGGLTSGPSGGADRRADTGPCRLLRRGPGLADAPEWCPLPPHGSRPRLHHRRGGVRVRGTLPARGGRGAPDLLRSDNLFGSRCHRCRGLGRPHPQRVPSAPPLSGARIAAKRRSG